MLFRAINFAPVTSICDPFTRTAIVEDYCAAKGMRVIRTDRTSGLAVRLQPSVYEKLRREAGLDVVVTCPNAKLLDLVLPLMAAYVSGAACVLVPGHYLANLPEYRRRWVSSMVEAGNVLIVLGLPKGAAALQGAWICVFSSAAQKQQLVKQQLRSQEVLLFDNRT